MKQSDNTATRPEEARMEEVEAFLRANDPAKSFPEGFTGKRRTRLLWFMRHPIAAEIYLHHRAAATFCAVLAIVAVAGGLFMIFRERPRGGIAVRIASNSDEPVLILDQDDRKESSVADGFGPQPTPGYPNDVSIPALPEGDETSEPEESDGGFVESDGINDALNLKGIVPDGDQE